MSVGFGKIEVKQVHLLVRDKDGNPKVENEELFNKFYDKLSDEDRAYLKEKYGYGNSINDRS